MPKICVTKPVFVDPGLNANSQYCRDVLVCHSIKFVAGDMLAFQQDSALTHHARDIIQLQQREMSDFIVPDL